MVDHDLCEDFAENPLYLDIVPKPQHPEESKFRMVGTGPACGTAGDRIPMVCPECGTEVQTSSNSCGHVECPSCWSTWARRAAERTAARTWGYFETGEAKHHPRHITFDVDTVDFKAAKKKALALGFTGGLLVIHPWRISKEYAAIAAEEAERTHSNRYDALRSTPEGMAALVWSPHVHILAYGKGIPIEKCSGEYQYRMIRKLNSLDAIEGVAYYLFSHTFIPENPNQRVYRYFGVCLPQKLAPSWTGKIGDLLRCPQCDSPVVFPGSNTCKEVSHYVAEGWHVVKKIPVINGAGSVVDPKNKFDMPYFKNPTFWPRSA